MVSEEKLFNNVMIFTCIQHGAGEDNPCRIIFDCNFFNHIHVL